MGRLGTAEGPSPLNVIQRKRVVLADDHALVLDMLHDLIEPEFEVVGQAGDGCALVEMADQLRPDIVLLNINLPVVRGLDAAAAIRQRHADAKLVFIAVEADDDLAAQVFALGGAGLLLKQNRSLEVLEALRSVAAGERYLTRLVAGGDVAALRERSQTKQPLPLSPREIEVLSLLVRGLPMKEAARRLGITPRTIAFHKYNAMNLLGLRGNADLIEFAMRNKLLVNAPATGPAADWGGLGPVENEHRGDKPSITTAPRSPEPISISRWDAPRGAVRSDRQGSSPATAGCAAPRRVRRGQAQRGYQNDVARPDSDAIIRTSARTP
jgi:DNA-binding NarL/FixJ family response regulator